MSKFTLRVTPCQKNLIFPPKDLEKIRALKIRMRRFFLKKKLTVSANAC